MAIKGCKKCKSGECEECPEWIFTLADMVMCLMGLFIILWVLKPPAGGGADGAAAEEHWVQVVAKIREAFNYLPDPNSDDPVDQYLLMQKLGQIRPPRGPGDGGNTFLVPRGVEGDQHEVQSIKHGQEAIVGTAVLFAAAGVELDEEASRTLDQIADMIRGHRNVMLVKGHASLDDFGPDAAAQARMDLSIRRAQVVADHLISRGVEPDILRVLGCSTFEPVAVRAYRPETQRLNRRVEVESTTALVADLQDTALPPP